MFTRNHFNLIKSRTLEPRGFIQIIMGPRQVGKTTLVKQLVTELDFPVVYISADNTSNSDSIWLIQQWEAARIEMNPEKDFLLIIDEIQKIHNWSEVVKQLWDEDTFNNRRIKVIILGSASLLIQKGLSESLAGRFEIIQIGHWRFEEMEAAFGFSEEEYAWFGGYPGSAPLIHDEVRFKDYVRNSLVETTISKDILMLTRVDKPSLLKRVFELSTAYSSQILSYSKMVGQLQDAGNTTTLSHYLNLLNQAGMIRGLEKIYEEPSRVKSSSPKIQVKNTAFISALSEKMFEEIKVQPDKWGRIIESAIGSHLINFSENGKFKIYYWKDRNDEVDFVLQKGDQLIGIEVKSGAAKPIAGMKAFNEKFKPYKILLVGESGLHWKEFLKINPENLF